MTNPAESHGSIDIAPEAIIKTVQEKRMRMLLGLEEIDKSKRYLMNELSETAVACKKIDSDEKISGDDKDVAFALAGLLASIGPNPFHRDNLKEPIKSNVEEPIVPNITPLPGETGQEIENLTYSDFIEKNKK